MLTSWGPRSSWAIGQRSQSPWLARSGPAWLEWPARMTCSTGFGALQRAGCSARPRLCSPGLPLGQPQASKNHEKRRKNHDFAVSDKKRRLASLSSKNLLLKVRSLPKSTPNRCQSAFENNIEQHLSKFDVWLHLGFQKLLRITPKPKSNASKTQL